MFEFIGLAEAAEVNGGVLSNMPEWLAWFFIGFIMLAPIASIVSILVFSIVLLLRSNLLFGDDKGKIKLGLSCSFAISNALIVFFRFALMGHSNTDMKFLVNSFVCIAQIAIFLLLYLLARHRNIEKKIKSKYDQMALLTTIFLGVASYSAYSSGYGDRKLASDTELVLNLYQHYLLVAYYFYSLWAFLVWHCVKSLYQPILGSSTVEVQTTPLPVSVDANSTILAKKLSNLAANDSSKFLPLAIVIMIGGGFVVSLTALFDNEDQIDFWFMLVISLSLGIVLSGLQERIFWRSFRRAILVSIIPWIPVISLHLVFLPISTGFIRTYFLSVVNTFGYISSKIISVEPGNIDYFKLVVNPFDQSSSIYLMYDDPFCYFVIFLSIVFFCISSAIVICTTSFSTNLLLTRVQKIYGLVPTDLDRLRIVLARTVTGIVIVVASWNAFG